MSNNTLINTNKITLAVSGLHCGNCAVKVEKQLAKLGLTEIEVNLDSNTASFTNSSNLELANLLSALKASGYPSKPLENSHDSSSSNFSSLVLFCCILTAPLLLHMFVDWHLLHNAYFQLALTTPVFIVALYYFGTSAVRALMAKSINMDVLIITGVIASYVYSLIGLIQNLGADYLFFESAASITCFVLIGNWIEKRSMRKTSESLQELVKLQAVPARRISDTNGERVITEIDARLVAINDRLQINNGDRIPVDGILVTGNLQIDESMITGESTAVQKNKDSFLVGGSLVLSGSAEMLAQRVGSDSVLGNIIQMVKNAQSTRPPIQRLGDVVSAWFVPVVITIALITFFGTYYFLELGFQTALMRSIAILVIACPCAMGLAVPTAVSVALGRSAKSGILFKSGSAIESLARVKAFVFDKTGTLTSNLVVVNETASQDSIEEFRSVILSLEEKSSHPIAKALVAHYSNKNLSRIEFKTFEEIRGQGLIATDNLGNRYSLGNKYYGADQNLKAQVYLYKNNKLLGSLGLSDALKSDAQTTTQQLTKQGLELYILSGDSKEKVENLAQQLEINKFYAEQKPEDKLKVLDQLQKQQNLAYVGDGINDAPALTKANVGVALSDASQIAIASAQVIISSSELKKVLEAYELAKVTLRTIKQNLFWAFIYNVIAIPLAGLGYLTPTLAALVMGLSDVIVIGNSLRLKTIKINSDAN